MDLKKIREEIEVLSSKKFESFQELYNSLENILLEESVRKRISSNLNEAERKRFEELAYKNNYFVNSLLKLISSYQNYKREEEEIAEKLILEKYFPLSQENLFQKYEKIKKLNEKLKYEIEKKMESLFRNLSLIKPYIRASPPFEKFFIMLVIPFLIPFLFLFKSSTGKIAAPSSFNTPTLLLGFFILLLLSYFITKKS